MWCRSSTATTGAKASGFTVQSANLRLPLMAPRMLGAPVACETEVTFIVTSAEPKGPEKMAEYRARKHARGIDGLPGLDPAPREIKKKEMKERRRGGSCQRPWTDLRVGTGVPG